MNRANKAEYVEQLAEQLQSTPLVVLADYRGITVDEVNRLRRDLEAQGVGYRVVKNTLGRRAVEGTAMEGMCKYMTGMTGWILSGEDPIAAAKAVREATKDLTKAEKLVIRGGYFDGQALDAVAVQKVADLPSREELLSTLLRTIQEGPRQILSVMQAPARDLLYLLKNYEAKLDEGSGAE